MKLTLLILGFLCVVCLTAAAPASVETLSHTIDEENELCTETNLYDLAACGCYVDASYEGSSTAEIEVCKQLFGEDLLSLKPHCKDFIKGGKVDVAAVSETIEKVKKDCFSVAGNASMRKLVDDENLEHSERILPALIFVALVLYATPAY